MSKITKSAKLQNCTVRLPCCNHNPETTVLAHINGVRFGHGIGVKTKFGAYACSACHDVIDGRVKSPEYWTAADVKLAHYQGVLETLLIMHNEGLVRIE